jgi:hypothetical protein
MRVERNWALIICSCVCFGIFAVWLALRIISAKFKPDPDLSYIVAYGQAIERENSNDIPGELAVLHNVTAQYPDHYEGFYKLGLTLEKAGQTNQAYSNYLVAYEKCGTGPTNFVPLHVQLSESKGSWTIS